MELDVSRPTPGWRGGLAAGALFVLPSVFILFALSWLYMAGGHLPWLAAVYYGLLAAVIAVVAAFVALQWFKAGLIPVIAASAVTGLVWKLAVL